MSFQVKYAEIKQAVMGEELGVNVTQPKPQINPEEVPAETTPAMTQPAVSTLKFIVPLTYKQDVSGMVDKAFAYGGDERGVLQLLEDNEDLYSEIKYLYSEQKRNIENTQESLNEKEQELENATDEEEKEAIQSDIEDLESELADLESESNFNDEVEVIKERMSNVRNPIDEDLMVALFPKIQNDYNEAQLEQYVDDNLKSLVSSIRVTQPVDSGMEVTVGLTRQPTPEEINEIKDYLEGQNSDGWGEGFEQHPLEIVNRNSQGQKLVTEYYVSPENYAGKWDITLAE